MVAGTDERAGLGEARSQLGQLVERANLPRDVVEADGPLARFGGSGGVADREEGDVVVVR